MRAGLFGNDRNRGLLTFDRAVRLIDIDRDRLNMMSVRCVGSVGCSLQQRSLQDTNGGNGAISLNARQNGGCGGSTIDRADDLLDN